jgi:exopolysaccharide biosynthesis polyprenyl glycosylphosphotransferase
VCSELGIGRWGLGSIKAPVPRPLRSAHSGVVHIHRAADTRPAWQTDFRRFVITADLFALTTATGVYAALGTAGASDFAVFALAIFALLPCALAAAGAWDATVLGDGSTEFSRLLRAHVATSAVVSVVCLALQLPEGRPWAFGVVPLAGVLAALGRFALRKRLHHRRRNGEAMARVLAVGTSESVASLIERTRRAPHHGLTIAGACTPDGVGRDHPPMIRNVRVVGGLDSAAAAAVSGHYDIISIAQTPGWTPRRLQRLAWQLEDTGTELFVDPGLMEVAGPRLHVANIDGLPLLRLTQPSFTGWRRVLKGAIDRLGALLILVLVLPLMIGLAVAVSRDRGPVFYRQARVGRGGREFQMIKFRTMAVGSDARVADFAGVNDGVGPLFKLRADPRITPVGRTLRRYSLDELPQLFNVLAGSMSLIGPRPPLPREVARYDHYARRRLLVKPGMTGLWQVSGRSDLSWDETVRLDLRYVENWTIALDVQILLKTVRAVVTGNGAY